MRKQKLHRGGSSASGNVGVSFSRLQFLKNKGEEKTHIRRNISSGVT